MSMIQITSFRITAYVIGGMQNNSKKTIYLIQPVYETCKFQKVDTSDGSCITHVDSGKRQD